MSLGQTSGPQIAGNIIGLISVVVSWLGAWFNVIPIILAAIASIVAIIYYVLQIYETPRVQAWQMRRAMRKLDRLRFRTKKIEIRAGLSPAILEKSTTLREQYVRAQNEEVDKKIHLLEEAKREKAKPVT